MYIIEDYETGTAIEECSSRDEAEKAVEVLEAFDQIDETYEPGFYAIREPSGECERVWNAAV